MINNTSYADHKEFQCTSMLAPWNSFLYHDAMFAPWNSIFCSKEKTNAYMKQKGFDQRYFWK